MIKLLKENNSFILVAFLVSFNVFLIRYSQEARVYSFLFLPLKTLDIYAANLPTIAFSALIKTQLFFISFFIFEIFFNFFT